MLTIPKPAPVWKSEADIRSLVQSARRAKASLLAILTDIDARVGRRRDELNKSLSDLDMKSRLRAVDAAVSTLKITLKNDTNPKRVELLREIARYNDAAKATIQFWDHPVHILLRQTIASAKRGTIYGNLAAAGPAELTAFASLAVAASDHDMAAGVICRLHEMPASARPVSPRFIADALVGELSRELTGGLLEIDSLLTESALANRMMEQERSGTNGLASVEAALKRRRIAEVNGARIEDDGDA